MIALLKRKKPDRAALIRQKSTARIDSFKSHFAKRSLDDNAIQLLHLVRMFFTDFFHVKYAFTFDELEEELKRRRIGKESRETISLFLQKLSVIGYSDETPSQDEILGLLKEFEAISGSLLAAATSAPKPVHSWLWHLFHLRHPSLPSKKTAASPAAAAPEHHPRRFQQLIASLVSFPARIRARQRKQRLAELHATILKAYELLHAGHAAKSRQLYQSLKRSYDSLSHDDQQAVHQDILNLYHDIFSHLKPSPSAGGRGALSLPLHRKSSNTTQRSHRAATVSPAHHPAGSGKPKAAHAVLHPLPTKAHSQKVQQHQPVARHAASSHPKKRRVGGTGCAQRASSSKKATPSPQPHVRHAMASRRSRH